MTTGAIGNSGSASGDDPRVAAQALEAYFLRRILSEVQAGGAFGGSGVAGSTFRGMFEEAIADAVSQTGQVGLADQILGQLEGEGGTRAAPSDYLDAIDAARIQPGAEPEGSEVNDVVDLPKQPRRAVETE